MTELNGSMKDDGGKMPVHQGLFAYFPRALKAVAEISGYGFAKYKAWGGWVTVENGEDRYENAVGRHTLDRAVDGPMDPESGKPHRAHRAWNALATLELELIKREKDQVENPDPVHPALVPSYFSGTPAEQKTVPALKFESHKSQLEAGARYDNAGGENQAQSK